MPDIKFINRKGTASIGEFAKGSSIRVLDTTAVVHLRKKDDEAICAVCGQAADIWLASETSHEHHPQRCKAPDWVEFEPAEQSCIN